ncbi:hypothetical protein ACQ4PT_046877 [Festuca glaucescens]
MESALSHKYHEGLLKLQEKDYAKACELLEDVLKDPLISEIQVENIGSDQHLLQLRFLTLKNLASVFLQQGSKFHDNALRCYLQAVELDTNDSVVWNHLGTLACKMGLLSISRWAFEQGLLCSPNNWNCMEKLLEVLIAIRDEVACLSVANLLLRNWPSHHRALHVKKTIENPEPVPFAPRGIDTLEPKHVKLDFSNKRKCAADEINQERKKCKHNATLQLSEAKWTALLDGIISLLTANSGLAYIPVDVVLSIDTSKPVEPAGGSGNELYRDGESLPSHDFKTTVKEKDVNSDREHPHERRSRRLERLRSRKSGKDEDESSGKDISHAITQFLDSFILKRVSTTDKTDHSVNADTSNMETLTYTSDCEADDVKHFLLKICKNYGPCHIGYMLLEEIAHLNVPFQDYFVNIIELDKLTRVWSQGRSALCSLFLAELYHDRAICSGSSTTSLELSDSSYHLCKIIGSVALELPFSTAVEKMNSTSFDLDKENSSAEVNSSYKSEKNASDVSESSAKAKESNFSNMLCDETSEHDSSSDTERVNWVRFFWLSGCVSLSTDCKERAYKEFNIALSLLTNGNKAKSSTEFILLPHTKFVKFLTADRILREINLIKLDSLLWKNDENIKNITHTEFKELLPPLLLSTNDVYVGSAYGSLSESERVISLELSALDVLISACEKAQPMDVKIYLDSHRRKIHILTVAAGMVGAFGTPKGNISSDADFVKAMNRNWLENVMEAVKEVSRSASIAKDIIDQADTSDGQDGLSSLVFIIGGIQSLLLKIMCAAVKMIVWRKLSCSGTSDQADQLDSSCLVDAAIAFCKLQHLDPTISVKTQVDLIVALHDLLAEYGLCCAGGDGEGEAGTCLKFAIKHLMALDVKLKSQLNPSGMEGSLPENGTTQDTATEEHSAGDDKHNSEDEEESDVYGNLYHYIAQAEDISASDKYTGFVLKKEGGEFVEQSANLFKYDLLYNPLRFESWQKLANLYDEVEIHELLALVYYDSLQNVVPFYDQRATLPVKDSTWDMFCQNSLKHFEKAFELKAQWLHAFYLGKLCEKLGHSPAKAFSYYSIAIELNPTAVDPVYRMHASRMKLLYTRGKHNLDVIQVVADYTYNQSTKENVLSMLGSITNAKHSSSEQNNNTLDSTEKNEFVEPDLLDKVWRILYDDCLYALGTCVEGELKHFHKARYKLAQGLFRRGEAGDLERAKEELSFCFKSTRSSFTVNMWEIDGAVRKGRKKNPSIGASRKNLEVSLSESSRKFITCIRKYMILYLNLLEKNLDLWTLERAYTYLRTDKRFALCLGDIVPVGLGKYLQVLTAAIRDPVIRLNCGDASVEQLYEKMFGIFMDHANLWADISTIPEVNSPDLSESNLYSYIHQYIHLLESDVRVDVLEALNEKIRKRFKTPKLSNSNFAKICKHASLSWCRCILIKLASITPLPESVDAAKQPVPLSSGLVLYVDLQPDELLISSPDGPAPFKGLDMNLFETLSRIKNIPIRQTSEDNMETAVTVMKSTYNFYRESSCGTFPTGVNLYTVTSSVEGVHQAPSIVDALDLSIPRKLLLWIYTLVHGRYANISAVVKYCDEMKARNKRGTTTATVTSKEKSAHTEPIEAHEANPSAPAVASAPLHQETGGSSSQTGTEAPKPSTAASQLARSGSSRAMENAQDGGGTA